MANMYVFSVVVTHGYGGVREFRRERLILVEGGKLTSDPYNFFSFGLKLVVVYFLPFIIFPFS